MQQWGAIEERTIAEEHFEHSSNLQQVIEKHEMEVGLLQLISLPYAHYFGLYW